MLGTLTGQRYVDDILRPHVGPFLNGLPGAIFQQEPMWDQLKRQMPSCHSVHDLELAFQDLWAHLPQYNIRCLINSMLDQVAHVLQLEVVQRTIEVAQYLCCTPCIRLLVLFLRSR
ncbi:DDE_3 domain-containing protein [Trichonephila clavipes]|nr:DDE_3 domain-containing protein [Trichonephila clavipes]